MANKGTAIIDFGDFPGSNEASVFITGQAGLPPNAMMDAWIEAIPQGEHTVSDHAYAATLVAVTAGDPVAGVGFTIRGFSLEKLTGAFTVGWVWVDPNAGSVSLAGTKLVARFSPGNLLKYAHKFDSSKDLLVSMGPFLVNQLFGFTQIGTTLNPGVTPSTDLLSPVTVIQSLSTDMVGPWQVMATGGSVDAGGELWTGGGHNSTGAASAGGTPTGRMLSLTVWMDGLPLPKDGNVYSGSRLDIRTVNRIQGYNTKSFAREILEEVIQFSITPFGVEIHNEFTALEALKVTRYYGLQAANAGMTTIHWPQGTPDIRQAISGSMNPGTKAANPNISRFCLGNGGTFNLVGWIDRTYGIGTCSGLFSTLSISFIDGTAQKTYFYMIRDTGLSLAAGDSSRWRGGYYFGPDLACPGADLMHTVSDGGARSYTVDFTASASNVYAPVAPEDTNKAVTVLTSYGSPTVATRSSSKGLLLTAAGAGSVTFKLS